MFLMMPIAVLQAASSVPPEGLVSRSELRPVGDRHLTTHRWRGWRCRGGGGGGGGAVVVVVVVGGGGLSSLVMVAVPCPSETVKMPGSVMIALG